MGEKNNERELNPHTPETKESNDTTLSRRDVLKMAGVGGIGLLLGSVGVGGVLAGTGMIAKPAAGSTPTPAAGSQETIPFFDTHQAGILTPSQDFLCFASFDLTTSKLSEVKHLFRAWTDAAAKMTAGQLVGTESENPNLPPVDTGEAVGLYPSKLTFTFGVGPSFFDQRFGLASKRPAALADIPHFKADNLRPEWCGGDIGVQVCANDLQVAFHAIRNLTRIGRGTAALRWTQEGFQRTGGASAANETPRNLMGFKDGTANPDVRDKQLMEQVVWTQSSDGSDWMHNGSYMVTRRIRMRIEAWDRATLGDQETTFGRYRSSGAPLGAKNEFDVLPLEQKNAEGRPSIPVKSHVRLSHGDGKVKILRRSYSYSTGIDLKTGQLDAGLFFICYQRNPQTQFVPIQQRLSMTDGLNEYISHIGSAVFACFPGVRQGGYIGEGLF
jgi:deferrochelatase/peroxidase EfeB